MLQACQDSDLASPAWNEIGIRLRVTLRAERAGAVEVDSLDRLILDLLEHGNGCHTRDIANATGFSTRAARTRLTKLIARGLVREIGTESKDPRRTYIKASV